MAVFPRLIDTIGRSKVNSASSRCPQRVESFQN